MCLYIYIYIYIYIQREREREGERDFMWCEIESYIYMQTLDLSKVQLNKVFCS